jgi:hypothetical protein
MRRKSRSISLRFFSSLTLSLPPVNLTGARFCRSEFSCTASRSQPEYRSPPASVQDRQSTLQHVRPVTLPSSDNISSIAPPFDFTLSGVRVPAVVISPYILPGTICSTIFDHTSVIRYSAQTLHPATWPSDNLFARAEAANTFDTILDLKMAPNDAWPSLQLPSAAASCNVMRYDSKLRLLPTRSPAQLFSSVRAISIRTTTACPHPRPISGKRSRRPIASGRTPRFRNRSSSRRRNERSSQKIFCTSAGGRRHCPRKGIQCQARYTRVQGALHNPPRSRASCTVTRHARQPALRSPPAITVLNDCHMQPIPASTLQCKVAGYDESIEHSQQKPPEGESSGSRGRKPP